MPIVPIAVTDEIVHLAPTPTAVPAVLPNAQGVLPPMRPVPTVDPVETTHGHPVRRPMAPQLIIAIAGRDRASLPRPR